ncbi:hypothetical protein CYMTET_27360 [Cymbomonas tetramitiformis]|uniref:Aminotransferase class I/classII domain-containing protein n=1 Tax=Cymbomonas tetramitiformis TaxID=36881 RepID=A0AAE0FQL4_9CHLO|nr:hypothetical protein CYMTET_27360 [Cymbomonas tetramitiformis]
MQVDVEEGGAEMREFICRAEPRAGTVAFPALRAVCSPGLGRNFSSSDFCMHLAETQGIILLPEEALGAEGASANHFRIGFGKSTLMEGLARFSGVIDRLGPNLGQLATVP